MAKSSPTPSSSEEQPTKLTPFAQSLLDVFEDSLRSTLHFGALGEHLVSESGLAVSRLEYVLRHCHCLAGLSKENPGIGLSSRCRFPSQAGEGGLAWKGLGRLSGLEVCQSWSVLLNIGHLFGTFATERGLLFQLDKDLDARDGFLGGACSHFEGQAGDVRKMGEELLDRAQLYRFHYLLALWRLRADNNLPVDDAIRRKAALLVLAFLSPPSAKLSQLAHIYRKTRTLAYLSLHAEIGVMEPLCNVKGLQRYRQLFPIDAILEDSLVEPGQWNLIEAMDLSDSERLFNAPDAAGIVLAHARQFRQWWDQRRANGSSFGALIDEAFGKPDDWPGAPARELQHFGRIYLPSRVGWLEEVRLWKHDESQNNPWRDSDFLVTPPQQRSEGLHLDLYAGASGMSIQTARHITLQLSRALSFSPEGQSMRRLWMTTARFVAKVFQGCLKPEYSLRLTPLEARGDHLGYGTAGSSYELARGFVKRFLVECTDPQRTMELRQLLAIGDRDEFWRVPALIMMARAEVISSDGQSITDLDGLLGKFQGDSLVWTVVETKKSPTRGGKTQLRDRADIYLAVERSSEVEVVINRQHVQWFTAISPDPIASRLSGECVIPGSTAKREEDP
ncbi:hypothetical protein JXA88_01560 [Candidatus Fermentibacteria bacterium]|nr:hypothetical protein [Candidatus Fermentibacteria bacterium]